MAKNTIEIEIVPFNVPEGIYIKPPTGNRQAGFKQDGGIPFNKVDPETLSSMCDDFRNEVFSKAGKLDPKRKTL